MATLNNPSRSMWNLTTMTDTTTPKTMVTTTKAPMDTIKKRTMTTRTERG